MSNGFIRAEVFEMHAAMMHRALECITDGEKLQELAAKFIDEFLPPEELLEESEK